MYVCEPVWWSFTSWMLYVCLIMSDQAVACVVKSFPVGRYDASVVPKGFVVLHATFSSLVVVIFQLHHVDLLLLLVLQ